MSALDKLLKVNKLLKEELERDSLDKRGLTVTWVNVFLIVAQAGEKGILMSDLGTAADLAQGTVSRTVALMSPLPGQRSLDVFVTESDLEYRHRKRVFLSVNGKKLAAKVEKLLA